MKYSLAEIGAMLQTPAGRLQVGNGLRYRLWPLLSRAAHLYRCTAARRTQLVAVVGSLGKTTTACAIAAALAAPAHRSIWINAWSSVALAILRIRHAQPHAVVEVGISDRGEMAQYARMVRPDIVVVTSVAGEHRTLLHTLEITRREKSRMVAALPSSGTAVLNGDDPNVLWMRDQMRARPVTFGFGEACDVRASDVRLDWPEGTRFRLCAFGEEHEARVRLVGRHSLYAVLAAVTVAQMESVPLAEALQRVALLEPAPGRMQPVLLQGGAIVLRDDYKSTLETVHAALDVLADVPARRRIVLLGDIWEAPAPVEATYRELGARVARMASCLVVVGEGRQGYRAGATDAGMADACVLDGGKTPQQVAAVLNAILQPGDVVLMKGRRPQRLGRVCMLLEGRQVRCDLGSCNLRTVNCEDCPMLEKGWGSHRAVT